MGDLLENSNIDIVTRIGRNLSGPEWNHAGGDEFSENQLRSPSSNREFRL
jgi:hypothetical protein